MNLVLVSFVVKFQLTPFCNAFLAEVHDTGNALSVDRLSNTLLIESRKLYFGNVELTSILWSVMYLKPLCHLSCVLRRERFVKGGMLWALRLSITNTTFSASRYCSVSSYSICFAQSCLALHSCVSAYFQHDNGLVKRKIYAVSLRIYR